MSGGNPGDVYTTSPQGQPEWAAPSSANKQQFLFSAQSSQTAAVPQALGPGGNGSTNTGDVTLGWIMSQAGTLAGKMFVQHAGSGSNLSGQTISYTLKQNGNPVLGATVSGLAANTGVKTGSATFTGPSYAAGDVFTCIMTPSAGLSTGISDMMVGIS